MKRQTKMNRRRLLMVWAVMSDGLWHNLEEVAHFTGYGETSVSSQIRDFRKKQFGGFQVVKRKIPPIHPNESHSFEYRLDPKSGDHSKLEI
jgi:hypothetical protein